MHPQLMVQFFWIEPFGFEEQNMDFPIGNGWRWSKDVQHTPEGFRKKSTVCKVTPQALKVYTPVN